MPRTVRMALALVISIGALVTAVAASASTPRAPREPVAPSETPVAGGGVGATCVIDHPNCNDTSFGGGGSEPGSPGDGVSDGGDPGPIPSPEPQIVEPTPGMTDVGPTPSDTATIGDDDRTLAITFWSGVEPCSVLDHVDVLEAPQAVTVTLFQGSDPSAGQVACPAIAVLKQVTVTLDQPLAGRDVVDGATT